MEVVVAVEEVEVEFHCFIMIRTLPAKWTHSEAVRYTVIVQQRLEQCSLLISESKTQSLSIINTLARYSLSAD